MKEGVTYFLDEVGKFGWVEGNTQRLDVRIEVISLH